MTTTADRPRAEADLAAARQAMIDSQLRPSGVTDAAVVAAMGRVPREDHVPAAARDLAYIDRAISLDGGSMLAAPLFHGRLLVEASVRPGEDVLIIGNGTSYLAALVRELGGKPVELAAEDAVAGNGRGAFPLILIDGAAERVPAAVAALLDDAGRIVTGLVERGVTRLATGRKGAGAVALLPLAEMGVPVLAAFAAPKRWSF